MMIRILINCAQQEWRKRDRYDLAEEPEFPEEKVMWETVSREEKLDLYDAIESLSFPYKAIIIQHYFAGNKLKEIAELLNVDGVYLDAHTFVGIARCEWLDAKRESLAVPDELAYTVIIQHLKVYPHDAYVQNAVLDLRAEWKFSMEICCDEDAVEVLPVNVTGEDGSMIREVRLLPYEIQVVTESGTTGSTLTMEEKNAIMHAAVNCVR